MKRTTTVFCLLIALAIVVNSAIAQPPDTLWTQTFGGTDVDYGKSVQQTQDGGYIITGYTYSFGAGWIDVYLIKTDSLGNELWSQTFGGPDQDGGRDVQQTDDGGYIITGYTFSFGAGQADIWLIKTDSSGNELWSQTIGGSLSDSGECVQHTSDGGYIITGYTNSFNAGDNNDVWLIKTDSNGNTVWAQTFGGGEHDQGRSVLQTPDGGYIIGGTTQSFGAGGSEVWLIRTDSNGNELWSQTYGGTENDSCLSILQNNDGGYIITGATNSFGDGGSDVWLIKTDADGNEVWNQTFGGLGNEAGHSVNQCTHGGYIISGYTPSFGLGSTDVWIVRTNSAGSETWSQTFGGTSTERGYSVQQTADGGYIIAGETQSFGAGYSDVWLVRVDNDAQLIVTITPSNPPVQLPPSGGVFEYNALVSNPTPSPITFDAWTEVDLTNGNTYGPILLRQNLTLPADGQIDVTLTQNIPGFLIAGEYTYRGCVGNYPDEIVSSSEFTFEKLSPSGISSVDNWAVAGWLDEGAEDTPVAIHPQDPSVLSVFPNPFNPTTTVTVTLQEAGILTVTVHNILGKQVATLANGRYGTGSHQLVLDAANLTSGIYFIQATVPGHFEQVQKVMLVR